MKLENKRAVEEEMRKALSVDEQEFKLDEYQDLVDGAFKTANEILIV